MNRRAFLALFGCGVVGLATDWSGALAGVQPAPAATGRMSIYEMYLSGERLRAPEAMSFMVRESPLLQYGIAPRSIFRWMSMPDSEIVIREQDHEVYLAGEQAPLIDWSFFWTLDGACASVTGCEYCGRAFYIWPSGGHCLSCGGPLPAPLVGGNRFMTSVRDGQRTVTPFERLTLSPDLACDYCGAQTVDGDCHSCGAMMEVH